MNQLTQTIGKWTCPSGNQVDATQQGDGPNVTFCWDKPLTPADQAYSYMVIRPEEMSRGYALLQLSKKGRT